MSTPHRLMPRPLWRARALPRSWRRAAVVLGALGAMMCLPGAAWAATPAHATTAIPAAAARAAGVTAHLPAGATAQVPSGPAAPSGICQVPGIGDIGGLIGLCSSGSGLFGDLNNICQPSVPTPEPATGGIDSLVKPPAAAAGKTATLYDSYGMAGQSWAAYDLHCSDMASMIGNNIAGVVFDAAKALDRVTITVYQSAAAPGILSWLTNAVNKLITALGNAIYFPYLAPVILLGAVWLAWQGLIRKRATRTIEGTVWMVIACAAAIWLIGRPGDFTGFGKTVSDGITQTLNVAFAKLPAPQQSNCVPVQHSDPQSPTLASYNYTASDGVVDTNANELWSVLVCKPWLDGEFGTTAYATSAKSRPTVVNSYGRQLLWAQAIAKNEKQTSGVIQAKENTYAGIASAIKANSPGTYALFTGRQWTTRLEIAFASLFAALLAGVLVLLIAITLIVLKLGFLLLLVAGPFFLIVGTHPGFGRVVALRWGEMLIGVLLKQAAIALVLSVLLYAYSLIMGTSDAVLPWALKILMISLVTVAVFIYRKPFTHLFSAVGYGVIGSRERAETGLAAAAGSAARNTIDAATVAVPGFAAYRVARWARRNPAQAAALAAQVTSAGSATVLAGTAAGAAANGQAGAAEAAEAAVTPDAVTADDAQPSAGTRASARARVRAGAGAAAGRTPPPLDLPPRNADTPAPSSGWARGGASTAGRYRKDAPVPDAAPRAAAGDGPVLGSSPVPDGSRGASGRAAPATPPASSVRQRGAWPASTPRAPSTPRPAPATRASSNGNGSRPPAPTTGANGSGNRHGPAITRPAAGSDGQDGQAAPPGPFWLRPVRRRK